MTPAPYTEINEPWPTYERGWWVRVDQEAPGIIAGRQNSIAVFTRIGLVNERKGPRYCIQFGAGGPFEWHHKDALTLATRSQVAYMEGTS